MRPSPDQLFSPRKILCDIKVVGDNYSTANAGMLKIENSKIAAKTNGSEWIAHMSIRINVVKTL